MTKRHYMNQCWLIISISCGIHQKPWDDLKTPISKTRLKTVFWQSHPDLPGNNELKSKCSVQGYVVPLCLYQENIYLLLCFLLYVSEYVIHPRQQRLLDRPRLDIDLTRKFKSMSNWHWSEGLYYLGCHSLNCSYHCINYVSQFH